MVCARSVACSAAAPGSSLTRIRRLARRLASAPLKIRSNTYDDSDLDGVLRAAGETAPMIEYRELDAAARAWLDHGDAVPLTRLFQREELAGESPAMPATYSAGMQAADECTVYRSPFDMRLPFPERVRQYHAAIAALPPASFDPIPKDQELADAPWGFDQCLRWPAPAHHEPPLSATPDSSPTMGTRATTGSPTAAPGSAAARSRRAGTSAPSFCRTTPIRGTRPSPAKYRWATPRCLAARARLRRGSERERRIESWRLTSSCAGTNASCTRRR
jgi:hypothetical protein